MKSTAVTKAMSQKYTALCLCMGLFFTSLDFCEEGVAQCVFVVKPSLHATFLPFVVLLYQEIQRKQNEKQEKEMKKYTKYKSQEQHNLQNPAATGHAQPTNNGLP